MAWRAALIFIKGRIHPKAMREGFTAVRGTWAGVVISGVGHILQSRRCRYTRFSAGEWLHNSEAMKGILEKRATGTTETFWGFAFCLDVCRFKGLRSGVERDSLLCANTWVTSRSQRQSWKVTPHWSLTGLLGKMGSGSWTQSGWLLHSGRKWSIQTGVLIGRL